MNSDQIGILGVRSFKQESSWVRQQIRISGSESGTGIAQSEEHRPAWSHIEDPSFESHQCLLTGIWKRMA